MPKTNQETINNIVWKACDTFRGTMDSSEYKEYVLTMLFVKYLSDFYNEKLSELKAKYNNNEERIAKSLKREKFVLDESCTFEYLLKHKDFEKTVLIFSFFLSYCNLLYQVAFQYLLPL